MINNKKIIAIIPARGGSKRLPRKNILPLVGKPLINWTIEAALASKYIDKVIVSTDDIEIQEVAQKAGADVPELRPENLSTDTATTQDVVFYILDKFGDNEDIVVILQPTSPLRNHTHIDEALEFFEEKKAFSVVSVTPCEHSPLWANTLPETLSLKNFLNAESEHKRSQDLSQYYRLNGAIYIYKTNEIISEKRLSYKENSYGYIMGNRFSYDIDTNLDFQITNFLANNPEI
ncbi:acylneuraminate cytidylyltransferase family protein [Providencia rettgeri]|uniref:acylneuraminate cytidylyltransferase family protein n=1 Tax=Providencia rettgeri TaxID=587 RepID=UPI00206259E1|nr:acylneuraminate cytidylyltransferase family protein [Providencia rettgeri]MBZ3682656.1 acylneuraminate cytidylyltransferase family protein [Providencia rettgeri]UPS62836.1 acylneuraminate cytidylyltransferase family protein [Providencia rettgeri]